MALQADGKIVAVGVAAGGDFALARYNPNGSLDTSFSGDGKQTTDFGGFDEANGVVLQRNGKIVGGRASQGPRSDFALARYNPNGSLDPSFSGDGKQTTDFGGTDEATRWRSSARQDRRGGWRSRHRPNQRFRACPLSGRLSRARVEAWRETAPGARREPQ